MEKWKEEMTPRSFRFSVFGKRAFYVINVYFRLWLKIEQKLEIETCKHFRQSYCFIIT